MTQEDPTEKIVREYFANQGWSVEKLDTGKKRAADFRVCDKRDCFLCEVKTVKSMRANFPANPLESYLEQRKRYQEEIKRWQKQNPDERLILRSEDRDFIYGDEIEFVKKYQGRQRNTEAGFSEFAGDLEEFLNNSSVKNLPYSVRLDSDDLYQPTKQERETLFRWLENEIHAINEGNPGWQWVAEKPSYGNAAIYSAFYPIHKPAHEHDTKSEYQLTVRGPLEIDSLEINIHSYGTLNLKAITTNVESGLKQLESSVSRENDKQIPCIVVLAFESGIALEWQQLASHISWLLEEHPNLSAIAVLEWTPNGTPPPQKDGMEAWYQFFLTTPTVPRFVVFHNSWVQNTKPLSKNVFTDKWSIQL